MFVNFQLAQSVEAPFMNLIVSEICRLFQRESHILQGGQRVEERIVLKEKAAAALEVCTASGIGRSEQLAVKVDLA